MVNWFKKIFGAEPPKKSAQMARERLMVIVSHERGQHDHQPDFLPMLQKELTDVIAKYVKIDKNMVHVDFEQKGGRSVLELNITLPEDAASMAGPPKPMVKAAAKPGAPAAGQTQRAGAPRPGVKKRPAPSAKKS